MYDLAPAIFLEKNGLELVKGEKKIFCNTQFSQHNGTFVFFSLETTAIGLNFIHSGDYCDYFGDCNLLLFDL